MSNSELSKIIESQKKYWLKNAQIPFCLLENTSLFTQSKEGLCLVDLEIADGKIATILAAGNHLEDSPQLDLKKGIVFPCFVDAHTHLDKGHIWERTPNPNSTFDGALNAARADAAQYWQAEDVYRRMEFGLKCSYAHGTKAIRTHIDSFGEQAEISFNVFQNLQKQWQNKLIMQGVCLVSLDYFQTCAGVALADKIKNIKGILGCVLYVNPELDAQLDTIFSLATERNLDLDFHADENNDPDSICLQRIATAALRHKFTGKITCGHCCSLAVQSPEVVAKTLDLVKAANISVISLPMCNLFLQDRQAGQTPFWRGVTLVHEFKEKGIPVAFASDNCRDPFYGFGDHDMWQVMQQSVQIAHLNSPYTDWWNSFTKTAADLMGLPEVGRIGVGLPADLVLFKARYFSELLSRSQHDRIVLREGKAIDTTLPDYSELDDLVLVSKREDGLD